MSRLRGQSKSLLWLVLVAWLFQLPLAALHSHSPGGVSFSKPSASAATNQLPPSRDKDQDDGLCPICWSIATASAALTAQPPALATPPILAASVHTPAAQTARPQTAISAFDARGPPRLAASISGPG